jgi:hypothetical protein
MAPRADRLGGGVNYPGPRIASPELFPDAEALPHLICSLPDRGGGDRDEPGKHGDTR